ncbi:hypothetical protein AMIS_21480 [Actinoplanes missouriensis 431]|uniref:Uncharacterized protein n=1 Tax=Actinoplanes missouriensis (strain ATCC 14538 / DSM 43046 / CBS 188.64 / JCM 3121 / NBRC 102363 / NCIMB 12654 / NRRL B-3342 / UNCC 431) TaxID=512565 RepID=I0H2Y1_ACTM4|nr:hypothetical protein [Actinoplanes missouriensis]BAL87368.1 hypothetical protein AMIS_21480 [Actinoplanes missouriensis 431]
MPSEIEDRPYIGRHRLHGEDTADLRAHTLADFHTETRRIVLPWTPARVVMVGPR